MPQECCAVGCSYIVKRGGRPMHRIPICAERRKEWVAKINRKNWTPKPHDRICGAHFVGGKASNIPGHEDYVPTIFEYTERKRKHEEENPYNRKNIRVGTEQSRLQRRQKRESAIQSKALADEEDTDTASETGDTEKIMVTTGTQYHTDYVKELKSKIAKLEQRINQLHCENKNVSSRQILTQKKLERLLVIENLQNNDKRFQYFTGIPMFAQFQKLFEKYIRRRLPKITKCSHFTQQNRVLMCLVKIRLNLENEMLAFCFGVDFSTVSRVFKQFIDILASVFEHFIVDPDINTVQRNLPKAFKRFKKFKKTRYIIDCTEIFIQRPSSLTARAQTWSNYKQNNTVKFLVACTPNGGICFISKAWGGRVSDIELTRNSTFYNRILPGDVVLADRGFTIGDDLAAMGCKLYIPAFMKGKVQLTARDVEESRQISQCRIHIERAIRRFKTFGIFQGIMPVNIVPSINKIATIVGGICNLMQPLVIK